MNQIQIVLNVFQCISVSPTILVTVEEHVILVITATLTTPARVLKIPLDFTVNFVFSIVHWVMRQNHFVLNVFQCISVSQTIPVRMEQHVISVLTTTLTTPALALQSKIVNVSFDF